MLAAFAALALETALIHINTHLGTIKQVRYLCVLPMINTSEATRQQQDAAPISARQKANLIGVSPQTLLAIEKVATIFRNELIGKVKGRDVVEKLFNMYSADEIADLLRKKGSRHE